MPTTYTPCSPQVGSRGQESSIPQVTAQGSQLLMFQCVEHLQNISTPNSDTAWKQPPPHPEGCEKGIQKRLFAFFFKSNNLISPEDCEQTLEESAEEINHAE